MIKPFENNHLVGDDLIMDLSEIVSATYDRPARTVNVVFRGNASAQTYAWSDTDGADNFWKQLQNLLGHKWEPKP